PAAPRSLSVLLDQVGMPQSDRLCADLEGARGNGQLRHREQERRGGGDEEAERSEQEPADTAWPRKLPFHGHDVADSHPHGHHVQEEQGPPVSLYLPLDDHQADEDCGDHTAPRPCAEQRRPQDRDGARHHQVALEGSHRPAIVPGSKPYGSSSRFAAIRSVSDSSLGVGPSAATLPALRTIDRGQSWSWVAPLWVVPTVCSGPATSRRPSGSRLDGGSTRTIRPGRSDRTGAIAARRASPPDR